MDVQLAPPGCLHRMATVLSLGLLPVLLRSQHRQYPATLSDDAVILRNGAKIPWIAFTRFKATDVHVQGMHMNTLYEMWYPGGRVHFAARQIQDADAVVTFILAHLPQGAREAPR